MCSPKSFTPGPGDFQRSWVSPLGLPVLLKVCIINSTMKTNVSKRVFVRHPTRTPTYYTVEFSDLRLRYILRSTEDISTCFSMFFRFITVRRVI